MWHDWSTIKWGFRKIWRVNPGNSGHRSRKRTDLPCHRSVACGQMQRGVFRRTVVRGAHPVGCCLLRSGRAVQGVPAIRQKVVHRHVVAEFAQDVREIR